MPPPLPKHSRDRPPPPTQQAVVRSASAPAPHPALRMWSAVKPFLLLHRFNLHLNYSTVIIGSLFFPGPAIGALERAADLLKMYVCFNVCLYGGIYTMNGITDAEEDSRHPSKRARPIPAGDVSATAATLWALVLLISAFALSYLWFGTRFLGIFIAFIAINIAYSYVFRNVRYSRFFCASLTSPTRLLLGAMLSHASITAESFVMAHLFMVGAQSSKIRLEYNLRDKPADGFPPFVLEAITFSLTAVCIAINLAGLSGAPNPEFCFAVVTSNLIFVLGIGYFTAFSRVAELIYDKGASLKPKKEA